MGADAVIVQGGEGGWPPGPVATTLLLPSVIDALAQAGSICRSSPRVVLRRPRAVAALAWCRRRRDGHRFLLTSDSAVPDSVKQGVPQAFPERHRRFGEGGRHAASVLRTPLVDARKR